MYEQNSEEVYAKLFRNAGATSLLNSKLSAVNSAKANIDTVSLKKMKNDVWNLEATTKAWRSSWKSCIDETGLTKFKEGLTTKNTELKNKRALQQNFSRSTEMTLS